MLFWYSMSNVEKADIIKTVVYHLSKVRGRSVRQQTVVMFANVVQVMAAQIAEMVGVERPSRVQVSTSESSPTLSIANTSYSAKTQRVGVLIADDFDDREVQAVLDALKESGAVPHFISDKLGMVTGSGGTSLEIDETFITSHPVLFDSYYFVGGKSSKQKVFNEHSAEFFRQAYRFFKPIGVATTGESCVQLSNDNGPKGVLMAAEDPDFPTNFVAAVAKQRFWDRV